MTELLLRCTTRVPGYNMLLQLFYRFLLASVTMGIKFCTSPPYIIGKFIAIPHDLGVKTVCE